MHALESRLVFASLSFIKQSPNLLKPILHILFILWVKWNFLKQDAKGRVQALFSHLKEGLYNSVEQKNSDVCPSDVPSELVP